MKKLHLKIMQKGQKPLPLVTTKIVMILLHSRINTTYFYGINCKIV